MIDNTVKTPTQTYEEIQAEINARKEEQRAKLTPEQRRKLEVIEDVSRQLVEAKVPFLLFADSHDEVGVPKSGGFWWQFNKVGYEETFEEMRENAHIRLWRLFEIALAHFSKYTGGGDGSIVFFSRENKPLGGAHNGQWRWFKQEESPEESGEPKV